MAAPAGKRFALDTNVLVDLANEKDFAHTFREVFLEKQYSLLVSPTVVQELTFAALRKSGEEQQLAMQALTRMREWSIEPFGLVSVGHGITERFAQRMIERALLPEEEVNDALILAETSLADIPVLVTSDQHLSVDEALLLTLFNESDLKQVRPLHPKNLLRPM